MKKLFVVAALLLLVSITLPSAECRVVFSEPFGYASPLDPNNPESQWVLNAIPPLGFVSDQAEFVKHPQYTSQCVYYRRTFPAGSPASWLTNIAHSVLIPKTGAFAVEEHELIRVESMISMYSSGTENHPYGAVVTNDQDDVSLATVGLVLINVKYGLTVCFFLTNEGIWAFQDDVGTLLPTGPPTRVWTSARRVADRNAEDVHKLALEYDRLNNVMNWYIEDQLVATHTTPGIPAFDVIEERVTGLAGGPIPASELSDWTQFLWNGHFPGGFVNGGGFHINGVSGGYVTPTSHVYNAPGDNENVMLYGAEGCAEHYDFKVKIESAAAN